eukprot:12637953-Alexandrium_andersonii.AAC.1
MIAQFKLQAPRSSIANAPTRARANSVPFPTSPELFRALSSKPQTGWGIATPTKGLPPPRRCVASA